MTIRSTFHAAMAVGLLSTAPAVAHEYQMTFPELVHTADAIFIGRVASVESFDTPGLVGTRVHFDAIAPIASRASANPFLGDTVILEFAGGSTLERNTSVCCMPNFEVGSEILVMTQLDGGRYFSPFSGGKQGLMRIIRDDAGQAWPVTWGHRGLMPEGLETLRQTDPVDFIRDGRPHYLDVTGTETAEAPLSLMGGSAVTHQGDRPTSIISLEQLVNAVKNCVARPTPLSIENRAGKRPDFGPVNKMSDYLMPGPMTSTEPAPVDRGVICWCGYADPYQNLQQVWPSWSSYTDNEFAMGCYNLAADVFRYHATDGSWGDNSDSEICGWPAENTIIGIYPWWSGWGSSTIAVCLTTTIGSVCGEINEADIFFNTAFSWRYDIDDVIGTTSGRVLYRPVIRHEIGHSIGFEVGSDTGDGCGSETYQYNQPCSMAAHTSTRVVENGKGIHALDAAGLRGHYEDEVETLEDVGAESYYASGGHISAILDPTSVLQGETFDIDGVTVENISSMAQQDVRLRVYLSTNNTISESDILIDEFTFNNMSKDSFWSGNLNNIQVPFTVSPNTYYVGLIATIDGDSYNWDDYHANNATWIPETLVVGQGNPLDHWTLAPLLIFDYLQASCYVNSANSGDDSNGSCNGVPFLGGVWYQILAPANGALHLYLDGNTGAGLGGPDCNAYVQVFTIVDGQPGELIYQGCQACLDNPLYCSVNRGEGYFIKVGGLEGLGLEAARGWLNLELVPDTLPGDDPWLPVPLGRDPYLGDLTGFTPSNFDLGDPCGQSHVIDSWATIAVPMYSGDEAIMTVSTCSENTQIDTTLSIYSMMGDLLACNDDAPCLSDADSKTSSILLGVQSNTNYLVRVACRPGETGPYSITATFNASDTPWDKCEAALPMSGNQQAFNTWGAQDSGQWDCSGTPIGKDVWMSWTAPASSWVRVGTSPDIGGSANFDSIVAIYDGCDPDTLITCNDDADSDGSSIAELEVEQGKTYIIQIGSALSEGVERGGGILSIVAFEPDSSGCSGDANGDGVTNIDDLLIVVACWEECGWDGDDLNNDGIFDITDLLIVLEDWGCM